jgi:tetratricopeptide (TPR) repeat protein
VDTDATLQAFLHEKVVLYKIDAEKGPGPELRKQYSVNGYPTFLLTNTDGETLDRWMGFGGVPGFIETATVAVTEPMTVTARVRRFNDSPNEKDAKKLGDIRGAMGYAGDAVAFYQRAKSLNPSSETNYDVAIFDAMADAGAMFAKTDVQAQADRVLAANDVKPHDVANVAFTMRRMTAKDESKDAYIPYLTAAMNATEGTTDESLTKMRGHLAVDHALYIEKDNKKALQAYLATMPKGWEKDAGALNNVAWWCFENNTELDKAEKWARKGVNLAAAGTEKANILDTLAEICAVKGDCGDSVDYIRLAIKEDPSNEYFQKQLVRFEALLAQQKG